MVAADKEISPEERNRADSGLTSYHEAGHAVVQFLFGQGRHIKSISMIPTDDSLARVTCQDRGDLYLIRSMEQKEEKSWTLQYRRAAYREIIVNLAGPSSKNKSRDIPHPHWCFELIENIEDWGSDMKKAATLSFQIARTDRRAAVIIRMLAEYTDELFTTPRVWNVTTALAEKLRPGVTMSGEDASTIMSGAWGEDEEILPPLFSLGSQWIRRLYFPFADSYGVELAAT